MDPTPERFRRLARSAPYRWRGLVLEGMWGPREEPVRVRVEQPDALRVQRLDGSVLMDGRQGSLGTGVVLTSDGRSEPYVPSPPQPQLDPDGLVVNERRPWNDGPELPMWQNYHFVATLDPYELSAGVEILELRDVDHGGRTAWEALLRATTEYSPRCGCCPLMRTRAGDLADGLKPLPAYADAHLVRLDVGTGVCVSTRDVGGPSDGQGHQIFVLEVDPRPTTSIGHS